MRLLLVHAHPDDETLNHGATIAAALGMGHDVDVVTCTRGEEGEVIVAEHAHRTSDRDDTLGAHREVELAAALAALAAPVTGAPTGPARGRLRHHWLDALPAAALPAAALPADALPAAALPADALPAGAPGSTVARPWRTYRDSGMVVLPGGRAAVPPDVRPDAFAVADLDEAAGRLAGLLRRARPHVVCTYGPHGGYGHPDHVMAHRVTVRALELAAAGEGAWAVPHAWAVAGDADELRTWLRERADPAAWDPDGPLPYMFVPAEEVAVTVEADAWLPAKVAALRALPTQVSVLDDRPGHAALALSNDVPQPLTGREHHQPLLPASARRADTLDDRPSAAGPDDPLAVLLR